VKRNRIIYALLIPCVVALGLLTRSGSPLVPSFFKKYAGDALWALVVYLAVALLFPRLSVAKTALAAGLFSLAVELGQLYRAPWIDAVRRTTLGALALGQGFLWSDLVCYGAGIAAGVLLERVVARRPKKGAAARAGRRRKRSPGEPR
jgi:hypothetical protein